MDINKTSLERAFELARGGRCLSTSEIKLVLTREGYSVSQITGRTLLRQLRKAIDDRQL